MRAVLLVDHGSKREEANALIGQVAEAVRRARPDWIVAWAHMEIAPPGILEGVAACVAAGATEIVVHPYFLGAGRHLRESIPEQVDEARAAYSDVSMTISEHLGLDDKLIELVIDRIEAVGGP